MPEQLVPILHVRDGHESAKWYARLGFVIEGEHQFAPALPLYLFLHRGSNALHLSEHKGDARPNTLVYLYVDDVDAIAKEFKADQISAVKPAASTPFAAHSSSSSPLAPLIPAAPRIAPPASRISTAPCCGKNLPCAVAASVRKKF